MQDIFGRTLSPPISVTDEYLFAVLAELQHVRRKAEAPPQQPQNGHRSTEDHLDDALEQAAHKVRKMRIR